MVTSRMSYRSLTAISAIAILMSAAPPRPAAAAKTKVVYIPAITLMANVTRPDGQPRVYSTSAGPAYWNETLPVQRGDKLTINVAVATGGADLKRVVVRLDNAKLTEISSSPWTTAIDTAKLTSGAHLIEAWAETAADKPQSATKSLSFTVLDELPAAYRLAGAQEQMDQVPVDTANFVPTPPAFLVAAGSDPSATVRLRSSDPAADRLLISHDGVLSITRPVLVWAEGQPNSTAVQFAYAIFRDGVPVVSSTAPGQLQNQRLKLEAKSSGRPGLRQGPATLVVWGIDGAGKVGEPVRQQIQIGGAEAQAN